MMDNSKTPIADCLLTTKGVVLAVCDAASAFNRASLCDDAWASTTPESLLQLFEFNSYLCNEMAQDRAISWVMLFSGVFRLRVELHEQLDQMPALESCDTFVGNVREASLNLSTGRIGWIDVEDVASSGWRELGVVPPGRYLCRMTGVEKGAHWFLKSTGEYPPEDEDWTLHVFCEASKLQH